MNFLPSGSSLSDLANLRRARASAQARREAKQQPHQPTVDEQHELQLTSTGQDDEAATLSSPWTGTGLTSPSSSEFETISDSEVRALPPSSNPPPSNLSRDFSRRRELSADDNSPWASRLRQSSADSTPDHTAHLRLRLRAQVASSSSHGAHPAAMDEGEGDDELSVAEEDGRGRGRTRDRRRREEDPAMKRSLIEDALRSSIATLLTLSAPHQILSPAVSSASLGAMINSHLHTPAPPSPQRPVYESSRTFTQSRRPFSSLAVNETFYFEGDEEDEVEQAAQREDTSQWEDAQPSSTSEDGFDSYEAVADDVSDDEGTQLGPRTGGSSSYHRSRAIAIPTGAYAGRRRERSHSDSLPDLRSEYSPIQSRLVGSSLPMPSRPADSLSWSRRSTRRRGHRHTEDSPGPASLDERRRARAQATVHGFASRPSAQTDAESDTFEIDKTFLELVDAATMFMSMSPRHSSSSAVITGGSTTHLSSHQLAGALSPTRGRSSAVASPHALTAPGTGAVWTPDPTASPASLPSSDPFLASSIPTLELSSAEDSGSPIEKESKGEGGGGEGKKGWWSWLGGEIKLWHLVSLAGIIVGVGLSATSLVQTSKHLMHRLTITTSH